MKNELDETLVDATNDLILTYTHPPKWEQIEKALRVVRQRQIEARNRNNNAIPGFDLRNLADSNQSADPEFVKMCIKLLDDKNTGKINLKQFLEGCDFLDATAKRFARDRQPLPTGIRFSGKDYASGNQEKA